MRAVHGSQVEMARPARHAAMMTWLTSSSCRLPAWSIRNAATRVPATFTAPTTMLPSTGDSKPAFANTCRPPTASLCISWDLHNSQHAQRQCDKVQQSHLHRDGRLQSTCWHISAISASMHREARERDRMRGISALLQVSSSLCKDATVKMLIGCGAALEVPGEDLTSEE